MSASIKKSIWKKKSGKNGRWLAGKFSEVTEVTVIHLPLGGTLTLFPGVLKEDDAEGLKVELCGSPENFRHYPIQGVDEPRVHFLAHADATPNFTERQPSYNYGTIRMKAKPLKNFPCLNKLCNDLAPICGVKKWNIGANALLYRDGNDSIGSHADNDQGESKIMAVVVSSPNDSQRRTVLIQPGRNHILREGDERYEIRLGERDGYLMDGAMQENYEHEVPKRTSNKFVSNGAKRLMVVLRDGRQEMSSTDSGRACTTLEAPVKQKHQFGQLPGLTEGESYSREHITKHGFHHVFQAGVSGTQDFGCDALVVSGKRTDNLNFDTFSHLVYCVEGRKGGKSLLKTSKERQPVRLFRSYGYEKTFNLPKIEEKKYRHDGLYKVLRYRVPDDEKEPYCFLMAHTGDDSEQKTTKQISSRKNLRLALKYMRGIKIKGQDFPKKPNEVLGAMKRPQRPEEEMPCKRARKRPRAGTGVSNGAIPRERRLQTTNMQTSSVATPSCNGNTAYPERIARVTE